MAEQVQVSPSEGEKALIDVLAAGWGKSKASIVMQGFALGLGQLLNEYEQFQRIKGAPESSLKSFLVRSAAGEFVPDSDLTLIAHDSGMSVEVLKQIRSCFIKEGSKSNAIVS